MRAAEKSRAAERGRAARYRTARAAAGITPAALVATSTLLPGFAGSSGHSGT